MFDEREMMALIEAYIGGDTLARKALIDALDEAGDPRVEQFRDDAIDWNRIAIRMGKSKQTDYHGHVRPSGESARIRFQIDCERFGSPTTPEVAEAVRQARRAYAKKLFAELDW